MKKFTIGMIFTLLIFFVGSAFAWTTYTTVDEMTDVVSTYATIDTESTGVWGNPTATLVVRCKNDEVVIKNYHVPSNNLQIYVRYPSEYIGSSSKRVKLRFGKKSVKQQTWNISTDGKAIFSPNNYTDDLLQTLMNEDKFIIRVTPYGENSVTAVFDITGDELNVINEVCPVNK
jgi:hypothetical protein